ncbi:MAG: efflux transporter outer membrane subunit [Pseudomonadota bacterium]|nr:efflux transporter outer membrane subunit [Pseudomonadota bacterium]
MNTILRPPVGRLNRLGWLAGISLGLAACNLAPTHQRPPLAVPAHIAPANAPAQAEGAAPSAPANVPALALDEWVQDERLRHVLRQALAHNRSLQQAVLNVERARAVYGITQANQLPTVGLSGQAARTRSAEDLGSAGRSVTQNQFSVQLGITAFELDFWGRVRNLSEAALQQYLAQTETQHSVRLTLVGDVVQAWLNLAADQQRLRLAQDTLAAREKAYELTERMHALGAASGLTLAQSQSTVDTARLDVAAYAAQVAKDRHALELLAGGPVSSPWLPGENETQEAPETQETPQDTLAQPLAAIGAAPAALPSDVLLRRPDIRAAEHQLQAMNANIGAARANFFPRISLTAAVGLGSRALSALFDSGNRTWNFAPGLTLPLFDGGANRASLRVAEVDQQLAVNAYDRAVQTAFREVADALAEQQTWAQRLRSAHALVQASQKALTLSQARFKAGSDDYLSVLDAQRSLYAAQQQLISLRLAEQLSRAALYKALGGDAPAAPSAPAAPATPAAP